MSETVSGVAFPSSHSCDICGAGAGFGTYRKSGFVWLCFGHLMAELELQIGEAFQEQKEAHRED